MPFHIRPKAHLLQHLVQDKVPLFGAPSGFWGYGDEAFVGALKALSLIQLICVILQCVAALRFIADL